MIIFHETHLNVKHSVYLIQLIHITDWFIVYAYYLKYHRLINLQPYLMQRTRSATNID
jgi:hypothetical protein